MTSKAAKRLRRALIIAGVFAALTAWGHGSTGEVDADTPVTWTIDVQPSTPTVGDAVQVTAYAAGTQGIAGIPQYTLEVLSGDSVLTVDSASTVSTNQLGVPVTWDLTAVGTGQATLRINVNYEKQFCDQSGCFFNFTVAASPGVDVPVLPASVGGISQIPEVDALGLEQADGSELSPSVVAAAAAVAAAGTAVLSGALWYAIRRRVK